MVIFTHSNHYGEIEFTNPRMVDGGFVADKIVFTRWADDNRGGTAWIDSIREIETEAREKFIREYANAS